MASQICFLLNERQVSTSHAPGMTVLEYLRQVERLTGTKEGCREGGCGACTVLLGELQGEQVVYRTVASCLLPLGELQGKHLVTVEGLNQSQLSPVQQALVDWGGTQCGFCTPGIVISLTGYLLAAGREITEEGMKNALSGNLCRCTGYGAIKRAYTYLVKSIGDENKQYLEADTGQVSYLHTTQSKFNIEDAIAQGIVPAYFRDIPTGLRQLPPITPEDGTTTPDFVIAGGTELYVQHGDILPESHIRLLNQSSQLQGISSHHHQIHIGALTTFAEFATHPTIIQLIPEIQTYVQRIASEQVRNRGTLGGNIVAASPIGDGSTVFLALESGVVLMKHGSYSRVIPLKDFFQGYKDTAKQPEEILTQILVPIPSSNTKINFEKVSKREYFDCAIVSSAIKICCDEDIISAIAISMGGVAAIPLFLQETSNYFIDKPISAATIQGAFPILQREISPISDVYGAANYKRLLARQLLIAHFTKLYPEFITVREIYETN